MAWRILLGILLALSLVGCQNGNNLPKPTKTPVTVNGFRPIIDSYSTQLDASAIVFMPDESAQLVSFTVDYLNKMDEVSFPAHAALVRSVDPDGTLMPGGLQIIITIHAFTDTNNPSLEALLPASSTAASIQIGGLEAIRTEYSDPDSTQSEGFLVFAKISDALYALFEVMAAIGEKALIEQEANEILNSFRVTDIQS